MSEVSPTPGKRRRASLFQIFVPNGDVTPGMERAIMIFWVVVVLLAWFLVKIPFVPPLLDVIKAFGNLWMNQGLATQIGASFQLNFYALLWATVISLAICYLFPVAFVRPVISAVSRGRFLGLAGLFVFFVIAFGSGSLVKYMMLIFGETVFFVTSMRDVVRSIPKDKFDHARTQGMSEWRVIYEVVVLGTFDQVFDIIRNVAAIGWTMLTMVEGITRAEGGLGIMLLNGSKHFKLEELLAVQLVIVTIGVLQDVGIHWLKRTICPYSELKLERR